MQSYQSSADAGRENIYYNDPDMPIITVIGDSTIDNRIWVDNIRLNLIKDFLRIKRDSSATRIRNARHYGKPNLSVLEHLMSFMPNYQINDYTNDGFTTYDCLEGAYKDKVFGKRKFALFPHVFFKPLDASANKIRQSNYVILSIGGNDLREFLIYAKKLRDSKEKKEFIKAHFHKYIYALQQNYLLIYHKIRELNPNAKIILMTQYYPSALQEDYDIYPFLKELGDIFKIGPNPSNPLSVIREILAFSYHKIIHTVKHDQNVIIADITSSLNPFEQENHVCQIEPSGKGGEKIAKMLKYVIEHGTGKFAYQFSPHFSNSENPEEVTKTPISAWHPKHPQEFYPALGQAYELLAQIDLTLKQLAIENSADVLIKPGREVYKSGTELLKKITSAKEALELITSLQCAHDVLIRPMSGAAIYHLKRHAEEVAHGRASFCKQFGGALLALSGVALIGLSLAGIPMTMGLSAIGLYVGGSLMAIGGATLFYHGREKSLCKAEKNLISARNHRKCY